VWDVGSGRELMVLRGHTKIVFGVAFSPDGKLALSGSDDDTLRLWEIKNGREITTMIANEKGPNGITSVAFSPDGKYILSGSYYGRMKQWDVSSGLEIKEFAGHTSSISRVAFSANGHVVLSAANYDKTLKTWAAGAGKEIRSLALRAHDYRLREARFSPDARLLLLPREDHRLTLLDADTGRELHRFSGHRQPVTSVAFSPTAKFVLSGSEDNTVKLWETASGRELRTFEGHSGKVTTVAFSPDGATVVSGGWDKTVRLWERNSGRQIRSYSGHKDVVWAAAISPDGQRALSIGHNDGMNLWDVETGREVRTFAYTGNMFAVMFSPDGKLAATSPELTLWNLDTGYQPVTFPFATNGYESVAFSTDSALLLAGQYDDASLSVWDLRTGREVRKATWGRHVVATSPGLGKLLATTKWERDPPPPSLELWDLTLATKQCEFNAILPKAREAIQKNENDAEAHRTLGEWYAFRGVNDWAVEMLEKARKYGADVSPLTLARCYWLLSEDEHEPKDKRPAHRAAAATEFQKEISRVKAQPVPQEPKAKLAREQEELYLDICLQAVQRPVTERTP
jgi:WD40 repeat protein